MRSAQQIGRRTFTVQSAICHLLSGRRKEEIPGIMACLSSLTELSLEFEFVGPGMLLTSDYRPFRFRMHTRKRFLRGEVVWKVSAG